MAENKISKKKITKKSKNFQQNNLKYLISLVQLVNKIDSLQIISFEIDNQSTCSPPRSDKVESGSMQLELPTWEFIWSLFVP